MFRDIFLQQIPSHACRPRLMVSVPLLYALGSRLVIYIQHDISERLWIAWNIVWGDLVKKRKANGASESLSHSCWSIPRGNERVITAMIGFPCTSQIRCVNIIRNIFLWSTDLQQVLPGILVRRGENKLALISFPTCWRKTLVTVVQWGKSCPRPLLRKVAQQVDGLWTWQTCNLFCPSLCTCHLSPLAFVFAHSSYIPSLTPSWTPLSWRISQIKHLLPYVWEESNMRSTVIRLRPESRDAEMDKNLLLPLGKSFLMGE